MLTFQKLSYIIILASRKGQLSGRKSAQAIKSFGVWLSLARAPGLGPGGRRFESCHPDSYKYARVAQLVERDLAKVEAAGSSPVSRSFYFIAETFSFS